jgi:hypothetical protein
MNQGEKETVTLDQTIALSQVGKAHDQLEKVVRRALKLGVKPEAIINFIDDQATQISNRVMREIVRGEVVVPGSIADDDTQELILEHDPDDTRNLRRIEDDDTIMITNDAEQHVDA